MHDIIILCNCMCIYTHVRGVNIATTQYVPSLARALIFSYHDFDCTSHFESLYGRLIECLVCTEAGQSFDNFSDSKIPQAVIYGASQERAHYKVFDCFMIL